MITEQKTGAGRLNRLLGGQISRKFEIIFLVILILSILSFDALFYIKSSLKTDAAVVDAAGRNRMLSQMIGFYAEQAIDGDSSAKETLSDAIELHDESFYALKNGGIAPGIGGNRELPAAPPEMLRLMYSAEQLWLEYKKNAETVATEPAQANGAPNQNALNSLEFIEINAPSMLQRNNDIVDAYVSTYDKKQMRFSLAFLGIIILNAIAIMFAFFLARSISEPLIKLKEATEKVEKGDFTARVSIKTSDELEMLGNAFNKTTEALARMDNEYKEVDRAKTRFLSITSHELRSPLTSMKAQLQMLDKGYYGRLNKGQKEAADIILRNTERLDNIIVDFLDISRIEAARLKFDFKKTNLATPIERLIKETKSFMPEKKVKIQAKIGKLPEIEVDADRTMQVLRNLLNNAIKFSPDKSSVELTAEHHGEHILFSVRDYGIGISAEDQAKLFVPFFQAENTLYRNYGGTGLGLAICKGIVTAQNGKIWVESELSKGSTFYFTVPLKPVREVKPMSVIFQGKEEDKKQ
jgi:signal transduction histidine kinase